MLDDDLRPVEPGSGTIGRVARSGVHPRRYYNDPAKTAETFVEVDGTRYVIPGDLATVEADGSLTLLGRGSQSINSGGEKIFPEEVEAAVKSHPAVYDAVVVGVPDERWGQRVAAVVQPRAGHRTLDLDSVQEHCRTKIAGYKVPRELHVVPRGAALTQRQGRLPLGSEGGGRRGLTAGTPAWPPRSARPEAMGQAPDPIAS